MKKYYTTEAKQSAINRITKLIDVVANAPGNVIDYLDSGAIIEILAERKNDLEAELKEELL